MGHHHGRSASEWRGKGPNGWIRRHFGRSTRRERQELERPLTVLLRTRQNASVRTVPRVHPGNVGSNDLTTDSHSIPCTLRPLGMESEGDVTGVRPKLSLAARPFPLTRKLDRITTSNFRRQHQAFAMLRANTVARGGSISSPWGISSNDPILPLYILRIFGRQNIHDWELAGSSASDARAGFCSN